MPPSHPLGPVGGGTSTIGHLVGVARGDEAGTTNRGGPMNRTMSSTTRLARALAVGVALAGLSVGTVGVGTAGAAQVDHPSSLRGDDDPPGDDHSGHSGGSDDGGGDDDDRVIRTGSCSAG